MMETPHVLFAASLAVKISNPLLSLPLSFASHFLLDLTPHWNPSISSEMKNNKKLKNKTKLIIYSDTLLSLVLGTIIALIFAQGFGDIIVIMLACFLAALPDLMSAPYFIFNKNIGFIKDYWLPLKKSVQTEVSFVPGVLTQIGTIIFVYFWLFI